MKKETDHNVSVDVKDLYQILIGCLRYAFTRNNHLEPAGIFDQIKLYLQDMYKVDQGWGLKTAQQVAEECIFDELGLRLNYEDEHKNRKMTIEFVGYLVDWICKHENGHMYMPYNYDHFVEITGEG